MTSEVELELNLEEFDAEITAIIESGHDEDTAFAVWGASQVSFNRKNLKTNEGSPLQLVENVSKIKFDKDSVVETSKIFSAQTTITTEGVMNGWLKTKEEQAKSFWTYNGVPVTFSHPTFGATLGEIKGLMSNMRFDPKTGDVFGRMNIFKREDTNGIIDLIRNGTLNEVSVGFYANSVDEEGTFENDRSGESQDFIGREQDMVGDHVAIMMPNERGACSPDMGCSIGNKEEDNNIIKKESEIMSDENTEQPSINVEEVKLDFQKQMDEVKQNYEKELNAMKAQPLINKLVELTGQEAESFQNCTVEALNKQISVIEAALSTRKGIETKNAEPAPAVGTFGYEYVKNSVGNMEFKIKEIGPNDILAVY